MITEGLFTEGFDRRMDPQPRSSGIRWAGMGVLIAAATAACGSPPPSGRSLDETGEEAAIGSIVARPDGGLFIVDPSAGGNASSFTISSMSYGRLVDVFDASGELQFSDFVVGENVATDGSVYQIRTEPVTQITRLTILAVNDPLDDNDAFDIALAGAESLVAPIDDKDIQALPPFPVMARNAALVLQFSDALDHATVNQQTIRLLVGDPPTDPLEARILPDLNHGILRRDVNEELRFHSTRVVIDMSVSVADTEISGVPTNALGLPPSESLDEANVAIRIPSKINFAASQFDKLTNASGNAISPDPVTNGPVDVVSPTVDVVRAMRSGASSDANSGFLRDLAPPRLMGEQPLRIVGAAASEQEDIDFVIDLLFENASCAPRPDKGDIIELSDGFFEVQALSSAAPIGGRVDQVKVNALRVDDSFAGAGDLLGSLGTFLTLYDELAGDRPECFLSFIPRPQLPPTDGVDPRTQIRVRFSEPMDPSSITALDSFQVSGSSANAVPVDIVSGRVLSSADLQTFTYSPVVGYPHEGGIAERYFFGLDQGVKGVTDLAGNPLAQGSNVVPFTLRNSAEPLDIGHYALRFGTRDEDGNALLDGDGEIVATRPEVRGQFLYNLDEGIIRPRPVSRFTAVADRNQPVTSLMNAFSKGLQTPLAPLGSKMMHVWRYCDFNFAITDESTYNIDVEGVSWAPKNGQAVADSFAEFRMRLAHSNRQPDEVLGATSNLPDHDNSGLKRGVFETVTSTGNILPDPLNGLTVVHEKALGYDIDPSDLFTSASGTKLMPFPMNQDGDPADDKFYTWRDTAILGRGGPDGIGVDLEILVTAGLIAPGEQGSLYPSGSVPSIALPLLLEYSTYPGSGIGLNSFDVSLAINSSGQPNFRLFATGGIDASGAVVTVNPDLAETASGGYNPANGGGTTKGFDVVFYHGGIDVVLRVSRALTMWIDAGSTTTAKDWIEAVGEPANAFQPEGTRLNLEFRGAISAPITTPNGGPWLTNDNVYDANTYDAYGNPIFGIPPGGGEYGPLWGAFNQPLGVTTANFLNTDNTWHADINDVDGAELIQVRMTFIGNPQTAETAELSGLGITFERIPEE